MKFEQLRVSFRKSLWFVSAVLLFFLIAGFVYADITGFASVQLPSTVSFTAVFNAFKPSSVSRFVGENYYGANLVTAPDAVLGAVGYVSNAVATGLVPLYFSNDASKLPFYTTGTPPAGSSLVGYIAQQSSQIATGGSSTVITTNVPKASPDYGTIEIPRIDSSISRFDIKVGFTPGTAKVTDIEFEIHYWKDFIESTNLGAAGFVLLSKDEVVPADVSALFPNNEKRTVYSVSGDFLAPDAKYSSPVYTCLEPDYSSLLYASTDHCNPSGVTTRRARNVVFMTLVNYNSPTLKHGFMITKATGKNSAGQRVPISLGPSGYGLRDA